MNSQGSKHSGDTTKFIDRWEKAAAAERANYQIFLTELCDVLGVARPEPTTADDAQNTYVFEKAVAFPNSDGSTSTGRIDLYRRGHFVCETKQGSEKKKEETDPLAPKTRAKTGHGIRGSQQWDAAMVAARGQAERYVRAIPDDNPPFVLVIDVGYSIEVYSDFSRLGKIYTPFPDARSHRIYLKDLASDDLRDRLRLIWTDPLALDPSRRSAKVTRDIADKLAKLAKSLEAEQYAPEHVAGFLMRCLFTLFAEDVNLIADHAFTKLLEDVQQHPDQFVPMVHDVWKAMDAGTFSPALRKKLMRFNGGLFSDQEVLKLNQNQIRILHEAARSDWRDVEPAIFGTLLERALDPIERHKLGAHYTPRAYVERLVLPTIIEPLREEWDAAKAAAITLASAGKRKEAIVEVQKYLRHLCDTFVLDPACGSGNFLYVTLEHMKRLEGEVRDQLQQFGEGQTDFESMGLTVDPHQFKGIEINPRAAHIADLVLWIGYLQWHFRVYGNTPPREPVLKAFNNIENRDAVLAYDRKELVLDDTGKPVTRWDGRTMKKHHVTGEDVPDESARAPIYRYVNPRKAEWPEADFVVGNPPFLGSKRMRESLGDGYVDALQSAWPEVRRASDFVLRWWHAAAAKLAMGGFRRFGFITTNSVSQSYNRRVIEPHLNTISLLFAIPDHPWVDTTDGANVRIAMTVAGNGTHLGTVTRIVEEYQPRSHDADDLVAATSSVYGEINADLSTGADLPSAFELEANQHLCCVGMKTIGDAFQIGPDVATKLGLGAVPGLEKHIRPYLNGRDLSATRRGIYVIDFYGLEVEQVRSQFSAAYQHLLNNAKPERDQNRNPLFRTRWWIIGHPRQLFRDFTAGLKRYIATLETSKHRFFVFLDTVDTPDSALVTFGFDNAYFLGVMSSKSHVVWVLAAGGRLGVGNDPRYNKTRCFDTFPFPVPTESQKSHIRELGEQLDAHRKKQQAVHPGLTITDMYNLLEKLRAGEALSAKEKKIHEQGLVSVLKQIHDDLDTAVFAAYGWPANLTDEQVLERLVALNAERAAEEKRGLIRWLRPEFQNKAGEMTQTTLDLPDAKPAQKGAARTPKQPWPAAMADQAKALRAALATAKQSQSASELAKHFLRAKIDRVQELLETLVSLGQARRTADGKYTV